MFTRRHFKVIAKWFSNLPDGYVYKKELYRRTKDLAWDNAANMFDPDSFFAACEMNDFEERIEKMTLGVELLKLSSDEFVRKVEEHVLIYFELAIVHKKVLQRLLKIAGKKHKASQLSSEFFPEEESLGVNYSRVLGICSGIIESWKAIEKEAIKREQKELDDGLFT